MRFGYIQKDYGHLLVCKSRDQDNRPLHKEIPRRFDMLYSECMTDFVQRLKRAYQ